ncbi:hypothetical protein SAMN05444920_12849 [Nonomuraea solani]|uniref:Cellulose-binding Sde182 C-terminal domain-containing protein n=1 Tax=Nonomuraea solani TaxID=1144553 RepID=A0A1H6EXX7_9ACTN|nr:hypothetical protein [Nonomuraea solani]SEH02622.1 hypothetical protein SAMN05444920_12849 [Nonomuraea solani]
MQGTARRRLTVLIALTSMIGAGGTATASADPPRGGKPRVILMADPELDDQNTLIRSLNRTVSPGQPVALDGRTRDPDGDRLTGIWWQYGDADTYPGTVALTRTSRARHHIARFRVPQDAVPGQTIHLILQTTDNGSPALTSCQRVVLTVG